MNESVVASNTKENIISDIAYEQVKTKSKKYLYRIIKRLFDIILSLIGLLFLIPVALVIKISYILSGDFKSIFFTQKRIGKYGKEFRFYKFRSMIPNADEVLFKYLEENKEAKEEYRINKKLKNDPRITKVGRVLRKASLDETPQFINIILGQMTFVGNRPYLPREKEDMGKYFNTIVKTKPGLTGYWQVSGRSNKTFEERLRLESYYSNHAGLRLDIEIFFKTFAVVLLKKGAK